MGGRRRLRDGLERLLPDHRSALGKRLRREYAALVAGLHLDGDPLLRREASRVAVLTLRAYESARQWAEVAERRRTGRGRRPAPRALERASRRAALDDQTAAQALDKLRALARGNGHDADPLAAVHRAMAEAPRP
jgi:hypothetical protein